MTYLSPPCDKQIAIANLFAGSAECADLVFACKTVLWGGELRAER